MAAILAIWLISGAVRKGRQTFRRVPEPAARVAHDSEHPARLAVFLHRLQDSNWTDPAAALANLQNIAVATADLVQHELNYYFRVRKRARTLSLVFRAAGLVLFAAGLVCPLMAAAYEELTVLVHWGYIAFALAGALMLANEVFSGTRGHIRYINAQFQLEKLVAQFGLDWERWRSQAHPAPSTAQIEEGLTLVKAFATAANDVIVAETSEWGAAIIAAVTKLEGSVKTS